MFPVLETIPAISQIESIKGKRAGGGELKAGENNHSDTYSSAVPSVCDMN